MPANPNMPPDDRGDALAALRAVFANPVDPLIMMDDPFGDQPKAMPLPKVKKERAIPKGAAGVAVPVAVPADLRPWLDAAAPLNQRVSYRVKQYADCTEADWHYYLGIGWVHTLESTQFQRQHGCCSLSGIYALRNNLVRVMSEGDDIYVLPAEVAKRPGVYAYLDYPDGFVTVVADILEAVSGETLKLVKTSAWWAARHGGLESCDYYGQGSLVPGSTNQVSRSDKYQRVCVKAIKSGAFRNCPECSNLYEQGVVKQRIKFNDDWYCNDCYVRKSKVRVILPWNDHTHPPALVTPVTRLGAVRGADGLIKATHKPVATKVTRLWGVEVEAETHPGSLAAANMDRFDLALQIQDLLGRDFCVIKEDGTLTTNGKYSDAQAPGSLYAGFEIVSAPADFTTQKERWMRLAASPVAKHLRAWDTKTCGFHIHVSRESLTNLQIGRIVVFVNEEKNHELIHKLAGRAAHRWCRYYARQLSDVLYGSDRVNSPDEPNERDRRRRVAVNLANDKTVEFRLFRGTVKPRHIVRNIEFCDAVCDYCYPGARSLVEIKGGLAPFVAFLDENRKKWPLLAEWLVSQGMLGEKPVRSSMRKRGGITSSSSPSSTRSTIPADALAKRTLKPETVEEALVDPNVGEVPLHDDPQAAAPRPPRGFVGGGKVVKMMVDAAAAPLDWNPPGIDWGMQYADAGQFRPAGLEAAKVGEEPVAPPAIAHQDNDAEEHIFDAAEVDENGEPY